VSHVRSVEEVTQTYEIETRIGPTMRTERFLRIVHADGVRERFRIWDRTQVRVELDRAYSPEEEEAVSTRTDGPGYPD
jgi:hypothetical protein